MTMHGLCALSAALVMTSTVLVAAEPSMADAVTAKTSKADRTAKVSPRQKKQAQAHFAKAQDYFTFGAFDEAVREYEKAYALLPLPDFLFNIGQVYLTRGDRERAIHF